MSVTRANAVINEQLRLVIEFIDETEAFYDPFSVNEVQIRTEDGDILQTIAEADITRVSEGIYQVVTAASWNLTARTVHDVWNVTYTDGATPVEVVQNVAIIDVDNVGASSSYIDVCDLKKMSLGLSLAGHSDEELEVLLVVAKELIDSYTGRVFGPGRVTERGETVVDYQGRILIPMSNFPVGTVHSVNMSAGGISPIGLNLNYTQNFYAQGYMYWHTSHSPFSNPNAGYPDIVLGYGGALTYEVDYTSTAPVPEVVKHATGLVAANLLKQNAVYKSTGAAGAEGGVVEFQSDDYRVKFAGGVYSKEGGGGDMIMTPFIRQLLRKYVKLGQSIG